MKYIILSVSFLTVIFISACSKSSQTASNSSLTGRWILTETLADPGDGSGRWTVVNPSDYYIQFNTDSSAEDNGNGTMYGNLKKFSLLNDSTLNLIYEDGTTFQQYYKIEGDKLTLMGGCIEACGSKYSKLSAFN